MLKHKILFIPASKYLLFKRSFGIECYKEDFTDIVEESFILNERSDIYPQKIDDFFRVLIQRANFNSIFLRITPIDFISDNYFPLTENLFEIIEIKDN